MVKDLDKIRGDVKRARIWARAYFPSDGPDHLLAPPRFDIEFLDIDCMIVYPRIYGQRCSIGVEYRLKWVNGKVGWEGYGVLSGLPMCWLEVESQP